MKKSNCICVTIMMLAAAALVVFGKSVLNTGMGFIIEHRSIFPHKKIIY